MPAGRIMASGVAGGGAAVVALGARDILGLKVIINVSGGLRTTGCSDAQNRERLVKAARQYGTKPRVPMSRLAAGTDTPLNTWRAIARLIGAK